jgi:NADPH:quinone reductase-like Zn-dependent oxidoreductase
MVSAFSGMKSLRFTAGIAVIQLAKLSGFSPIFATASDHNTSHLKSLGATHVLSRSAPADVLAAEIAKVTSEPLKLVYDAVSLSATQQVGWKLLAPGGQFILVLPAVEGVGDGADGKSIVWVGGNVNFPGQGELGKELFARLTNLLADGSIKVSYMTWFEPANTR